MQLAPKVMGPSQYTAEERAVIAGFLLWARDGTLKALRSSERGATIVTDIGQQNQAKYYSNCEEYSRWLLYWTGYQVERKQMYAPAPSP